jgi:endonuclease/exonuclease/phosphatase (EEP) superfamily protein YafD
MQYRKRITNKTVEEGRLLLEHEKFILCTPKNLGRRPNPNGRESSTIDLTFSSPDLANLTITNVGPYWGSDHLPVTTRLSIG